MEGTIHGLLHAHIQMITELDQLPDHGGVFRNDHSRSVLKRRDFSVGVQVHDIGE